MSKCTIKKSKCCYGQLIFICICIFCTNILSAEVFRFQFQEGDKYRILSEIQQDVYENGNYLYSAELFNRIQVEIGEVRERANGQAAAARSFVQYQQSEESDRGVGEAYKLNREYSADYWLNEFGSYEIDSRYTVPSVRNVPLFPKENIQVGESWSARGQEVLDLRHSFGVDLVYTFSMPVNYVYMGQVERNGKRLHHLKIDYAFNYSEEFLNIRQVYPYRVTGFSDQNYYFDNERGRPHSYQESYEINLELTDGSLATFRGTARAEIIESLDFDRQAIEEDIRNRLNELNIENSTVSSNEAGVTISLENIQFLPDSSDLLPSELAKLDQIAKILEAYSDRDIFVAGHAARAGTVAGQQRVSEDRAEAVVDYLIDIGARSRSEILYQGYGASRPIDSNNIEQGRRRNRRVEIIILEN